MKAYPIYFFLSLLISTSLIAQDFEQRAEQILQVLREREMIEPGGAGKLPFGMAAARLAANPTDAESLNYVAESGHAGEPPFNVMYQLRAYFLGKAYFSPAQKAEIKATAQSVDEWDLDYTENHKILLWSNAYLIAQEFPDGLWNWGGQATNSATVMAEVRLRLISYGQSVFDRGYSDLLSPTYDVFKVAAWMNLYDFADDAEVKAMADAMLTYHFALLALGSFEEVILPPYSRGPGAVFDNALRMDTQWIHWLFWGLGGNNAQTAVDPSKPEWILALTGWRPPARLYDIVHGNVEMPYRFQTQQPFFFAGDPLHMVRTSYRAPSYAISSGVYRMDMNALEAHGARQLVHDDAFAIAWKSQNSLRYLSAMHPYWNGAAGEDDWTSRGSPFMQVVQHDNTAIVAFDIPGTDPWADISPWSGTRAETPLAIAEIRYPYLTASYDDTWGDDWVSLSEGDTYVAIKMLKPGWLYDRRALQSEGFRVIKSRGTNGERWKTGFVFVCGSRENFTTLEDFMAMVTAHAVSVDWDEWTIHYTNPDGHVLEMQYTVSLEVPGFSVPAFSVDGVSVDYANWPHMQSPFISGGDQSLSIFNDDNMTKRVIDWTEPVPVIETRSLEAEVWAGYPWETSGWVNTGGYLGWIFPVDNWVYAELIDNYIYIPEENVAPGGAWMYIPQ